MTDSSEDSRLFVAIALPLQQRERLAEWCGLHQKSWDFKRWVHPEDYHITLKYLGPVPQSRMESVKHRLKTIAPKHAPFTLALEKTGTFGVPEKPRILWAGVGGEESALHALQQAVEAAMADIGFAKEKRPYRPHVTVAKKYRGAPVFSAEHKTSFTGMEWQVEEIVLYQTHLTRRPMYEALAKYPLANTNVD